MLQMKLNHYYAIVILRMETLFLIWNYYIRNSLFVFENTFFYFVYFRLVIGCIIYIPKKSRNDEVSYFCTYFAIFVQFRINKIVKG